MDLAPLIGFAVAVALVVAVLRYLSRPHTVLRIGGGRVTVVRGSPPSGLVPALHDVASGPGARDLEGRIELRGGGDRLEVGTPGIDDPTSQRIRNIVFMYRDRIR